MYNENINNTINETEINEVPIWLKLNLTIEEAAKYSNIGINKLQELTRQPRCPFVLRVGKKKLIKRAAFEKFLESKYAI